MGTALAVIIPEGVRALFNGAPNPATTAHDADHEDHGEIKICILNLTFQTLKYDARNKNDSTSYYPDLSTAVYGYLSETIVKKKLKSACIPLQLIFIA